MEEQRGKESVSLHEIALVKAAACLRVRGRLLECPRRKCSGMERKSRLVVNVPKLQSSLCNCSKWC